MNKRLFLMLLSAVLFSVPAWSDCAVIDLQRDDHIISGGRSIVENLTADIDDGLLTIYCSEDTKLRVVISPAVSPQTPVIDESFDASESVTEDLSSFVSGNYVLRVYAYGYWWIGYFEID